MIINFKILFALTAKFVSSEYTTCISGIGQNVGK